MSLARTARMLAAPPLPQPSAIATAVEQANLWTVTAAPIVKAIFAIEDARHECLQGLDTRTWEEARPIIGRADRELREMLDGIRENFICDHLPPHPSRDDDDEAWDAHEAFTDELRRDVTTVDALIRKMEREA